MSYSIQRFCDWLAATPLSSQIQTVDWIIPTVQTIHILSISLILGAAAMINLRVLGLLGRGRALAAVGDRFFPWIWWTLLALLLSGSALIIGEPGRSLPNIAFQLKMGMLVLVLTLTAILQHGLTRDDRYWEVSSGRRLGSTAAALMSLALWIGIVFAGRWIAYVDANAT
jgi:hypothetical protein